MAIVVSTQKRRMEDNQRTIHWGGEEYKVREIVNGVLKVVEESSPLISVGMSAAPPYVLLPWSVISILIAVSVSNYVSHLLGRFLTVHWQFVNKNLATQQIVVDGLQNVTSILASYRLVEQELLSEPSTKNEYGKHVVGLYTAIIEYQASAAQFFGEIILKDLGRIVTGRANFKDLLTEVNTHKDACDTGITCLGIRLTKCCDDSTGQTLYCIDLTTILSTTEQDLQWAGTLYL